MGVVYIAARVTDTSADIDMVVSVVADAGGPFQRSSVLPQEILLKTTVI